MKLGMEKVILFAVGSYNPITIMHLRMFELARDYFRGTGRPSVIGGVLSPVNDKYPKQGLATAQHRFQMATLGASISPEHWVKVSPWETLETSDWTRTCVSLMYHQNQIDKILKESPLLDGVCNWMPNTEDINTMNSNATTPVRLKLLCGADVLESFNIPDLWSDEHMETIVRDFGIVVITRSGQDPEASIERNPILKKYRNNIFVVEEKVKNEISSTKVREAIRNEESIQYLVPDPVIEYINTHQLYR